MADVRLDFYDLDADALPDVCMKCSAPPVMRKRKTFSWYPQWVPILILVGLLPFLIVAVVLTKRRMVYIPFCEAHKNHWLWRGLATLGGLAVPVLFVVAAVLAGQAHENDLAGLFGVGILISLLAWLIAVCVFSSTAIGAREITNYDITLKNVGPDFVRAYYETARGYDRRPTWGGRDDYGRGRRPDDYDARRPPGAHDDKLRRPGAADRPEPPPDDKYTR